MITRKYLDELEYNVMGACIEVHKALGAGLLESVYQKCLEKEFELRGINFSSEHVVMVNYKGMQLDTLLRADFLIENTLVLEIKAVEATLPIHEAQVLTYMKLLESPKGLVVNFNTTNIYHRGRKSFANQYYSTLL